jgi:sporulation protein YlmC with PRC-barrel domain
MMRLTDVLGATAETESGERLGHVFDVRVEEAGDRNTWRVVGLVVGAKGLAERFGLRRSAGEDRLLDGELVPWERVVQVEDGRVVVRRG